MLINSAASNVLSLSGLGTRSSHHLRQGRSKPVAQSRCLNERHAQLVAVSYVRRIFYSAESNAELVGGGD